MNRKNILFILCLLGISFTVCSQTFAGKERIKALKMAFITERLQLSAEEAQKFWPIYNEYDENTHQLRNVALQNLKNNFRESMGNSIPENEARKLLDEMETIEAKLFEQRKKLTADLKKVLPAKKIILLKTVEDDFNQQLLEKLRERREKRFGIRN
jgi:hypothetical protein